MGLNSYDVLSGVKKAIYAFTGGAANTLNADVIVAYGSDGNPAPSGSPSDPAFVQTPVPALPLSGQKKVSVSGTAVALGSGALHNGVVITAKTTNAGNIFVGLSGVLTTDDGTGNGYRLLPGQSISFAVADLSAIYINGTAGDSIYFAGN